MQRMISAPLQTADDALCTFSTSVTHPCPFLHAPYPLPQGACLPPSPTSCPKSLLYPIAPRSFSCLPYGPLAPLPCLQSLPESCLGISPRFGLLCLHLPFLLLEQAYPRRFPAGLLFFPFCDGGNGDGTTPPPLVTLQLANLDRCRLLKTLTQSCYV